jgi:hypothetical protein
MAQRGQLDRLPVAHAGPVLSLDWCGPHGATPLSNVPSSIVPVDGADVSSGWLASGGMDKCVKVDIHLLLLCMRIS